MSEELYYLQDARNYVGNSMLWWRAEGAGYTSNIDEAGTFSRERAYGQHAERHTDRPWRKDYIDARIKRHVDHQNCARSDPGAA